MRIRSCQFTPDKFLLPRVESNGLPCAEPLRKNLPGPWLMNQTDFRDQHQSKGDEQNKERPVA